MKIWAESLKKTSWCIKLKEVQLICIKKTWFTTLHMFQMQTQMTSCPTWESELAKLAIGTSTSSFIFDPEPEFSDSSLQVCLLCNMPLFCSVIYCVHPSFANQDCPYFSHSGQSDVWVNGTQPRQLSGCLNTDPAWSHLKSSFKGWFGRILLPLGLQPVHLVGPPRGM